MVRVDGQCTHAYTHTHTHTCTRTHTHTHTPPPFLFSKGKKVAETVANILSTWSTLKSMNLLRVLQQGFPVQEGPAERCGLGWGRGGAGVGQGRGNICGGDCCSLSAIVGHCGVNCTEYSLYSDSVFIPSLPPCCCRLRNIMENMIKLLVSLFEMAFLMSKVNLELELEFG